MAHPTSAVAVIVALTVALGSASATAQQSAAPEPDSELKRNFAAEHEIGRRYHIDPADLPAPKAGSIVTGRSLIVPYSGQALQVPQGFVATPFVTGLANPRRLLVLPNGDVLVVEQSAGYVTLLRDDGEGHVKWIDRHVEDLNRPYGIAWQGDHLLVADQDGIWQVPHIVGAVRPGRPVPAQRADELPPDQRRPVAGAYGAEMVTKKGVFGIVQGHQNRDLKIDPKSGALFVGVGSSGNLGVEPEPKATIQRFDADGSNQTTYASGTRNPTALAFQPDTGAIVGAGAGARRARGQSAERLSDPRAAERVLRMALRVYRQASADRVCQPGTGEGRGLYHARSFVPGALVGARPRVL